MLEDIKKSITPSSKPHGSTRTPFPHIVSDTTSRPRVPGVTVLPNHTTRSSTSTSTSSPTTTPSSYSKPTSTKPSHSSTRPIPLHQHTRTPAVNQNDSTTGVSTGAAAGIGVGCALGGAILASIILFLLMRRSSRSSSKRVLPVNAAPLGGQFSGSGSDNNLGKDWNVDHEKHSSALIAALEKSPTSSDYDHVIPPPLASGFLDKELVGLDTLIRNHLQTYFHENTIEREALVNLIERSALMEICVDTPFSPDEWIDLLVSTKTRMNAIRFILGWVIFRRLEPECEPTKTLLPPGFTACYRHMLELSENKQAGDLLQSRWRTITGYLLREQYVTRAFTANDDRLTNLKSTADLLDGVLHPLGAEELNVPRKENLKEILNRAANIGFTLATQPSSWIFDWDNPQDGDQPKPLVVFPSLAQYADDHGRRVHDPLEIGSKEVGNSILISS